jgi:hypothetical protein
MNHMPNKHKPEPPIVLPPVAEVLASMFTKILPSVSERNTPTTSRIGVLPDGTLLPVLVLLATIKYQEDFDEETHSAIWTDGNPSNETWSNISLREVRTRKRTSGIKGIKAGTPEYWREYRRLHKEKNAGYQKAYRTRRNNLLAALQSKTLPLEAPVVAEVSEAEDEILSLLREP